MPLFPSASKEADWGYGWGGAASSSSRAPPPPDSRPPPPDPRPPPPPAGAGAINNGFYPPAPQHQHQHQMYNEVPPPPPFFQMSAAMGDASLLGESDFVCGVTDNLLLQMRTRGNSCQPGFVRVWRRRRGRSRRRPRRRSGCESLRRRRRGDGKWPARADLWVFGSLHRCSFIAAGPFVFYL